MNQRSRSPILTLVLIALALIFALAMGALIARHDFLLRGIPSQLPQPIPAGQARLGMNVDLVKYDEAQLTEALGQIRDAGASAVKQGFNFSADFDWRASDRLVGLVEQSGLNLVVLLDGDPGIGFNPPKEPTTFAGWAGSFADRYGDFIEAYIIWDEPNLAAHWGGQPVNPAEYAVLLGATAQAIRRSDPTALIVSAPLAPTVEEGPENLSDISYLHALYAAGAADFFDVVGSKPYGFDSGPEDRTVNQETLNFSRVVLLREVMEANGDASTAIWAGNWGWNSLPEGWSGPPSIWGQVDGETRAEWTVAGLERAVREWPWMGYMFLEGWAPDAPAHDPWQGFAIAGTPTAKALAARQQASEVAYSGFHPANPSTPAQAYEGNWRFSPELGADIGESGDRVQLRFWGTDVGVRVRRADNSARFHALLDGQPVNALPRDERGSVLVLNASIKGREETSMDLIASDLPPGEHVLELTAYQGWGQWALAGFSVAYRPQDSLYRVGTLGLGLGALVLLLGAIATARKVDWGPVGHALTSRLRAFDRRWQMALTAATAVIVALTGWLTWGEQAAGVYRRLDSSWQLALTAVAASTFYFTPSVLLYAASLGVLFALIYVRPAWGLALVAATAPFYVLPKPLMGYRFSPVEVFLAVTAAAAIAAAVVRWRSGFPAVPSIRQVWWRLTWPDKTVLLFLAVATMSLFFANRMDLALDEWRVVILEPAIFYLLIRQIRLSRTEMWTIVDAFVLGALIVAAVGLWQYFTGQNLITSEAGLMRLRSVFGSPNNVALYLGRVMPVLLAIALMGGARRRTAYIAALFVIGLAAALTFSKGAVFLGLPAAAAVVLSLWLRERQQRVWPWLLAGLAAMLVLIVVVTQVPQLAARLDPRGDTGFLRLNLWLASLNMFLDRPLFGVGLDNFLYAYRSRYILMSAWQEPNLNHPHNLLLDLATRLGILGLLAGSLMFWIVGRVAYQATQAASGAEKGLAIGLFGGLVYALAHGLVDHSFFLTDLAYAFYLLAGLSMWLRQGAAANSSANRVEPEVQAIRARPG